jgi:hypothetical protein
MIGNTDKISKYVDFFLDAGWFSGDIKNMLEK